MGKSGCAGELMMEFPDIGVEFIPVTDCLRSTIITISLSWRIICFNISFSWVLKTPAFRSFWNFCSSKEFFFPVGSQSGDIILQVNGRLKTAMIKMQLVCVEEYDTFALVCINRRALSSSTYELHLSMPSKMLSY